MSITINKLIDILTTHVNKSGDGDKQLTFQGGWLIDDAAIDDRDELPDLDFTFDFTEKD